MMLSSGIAMEIHYCMGKRAGVDFYKTENDKCGRCGMKEKKTGCCHDEHQFHKLEDSHKNVYNDISFEAGTVLLITSLPLFAWQVPLPVAGNIIRNNDPPLIAAVPIRIMNAVFRL